MDDIVGAPADIFEKEPEQVVTENVTTQEQVATISKMEEVAPTAAPENATAAPEEKVEPVDAMLSKLPKDVDLNKMTGIVISELGLKATAAEELVGEALRLVENDFADNRRIDYNNFQREVLTHVYGAVEEARYQIEKQQKAEYERDVRITVAAQKMFGEDLAQDIVSAAEANFEKNTRIPKHLIKKSLGEEGYVDMLRAYRGSEDHFKVMNKDLSAERTQDMAQKALNALGLKYEQPKTQRQPNYADIRRGKVDEMLQKYSGETKH